MEKIYLVILNGNGELALGAYKSRDLAVTERDSFINNIDGSLTPQDFDIVESTVHTRETAFSGLEIDYHEKNIL
jgi:hypothetical protein